MIKPQANWQEALEAFVHPRVITMLFLGLSAGIPILLIFSSLSLWLREAGVERSAITFFSWAALGYSFKFVWAPLVDQLPLPLLTRRLGRRRGWLLLAQLAVIAAIIAMAAVDPSAGDEQLVVMAIAAIALGFSSATQDIVIDAYRIESAEQRLQGMMAAAYTAGYRIAMIIAGAGALILAASLGSTVDNYQYQAWSYTYGVMAAVMLIGVATTLSIGEPEVSKNRLHRYSTREYGRFLLLFALCVGAFVTTFYFSSALAGEQKTALTVLLANAVLATFVVELLRLLAALGFSLALGGGLLSLGLVQRQLVQQTYLAPVQDFFSRYGLKPALLLLLLIGTYRISDIVLGVISNVFYLDMGFNKEQIAAAVKTFGVVMAIFGGFTGGLLALRYGVLRMLFVGALLSAATNLLFVWLAGQGGNVGGLYLVVAIDNLSAGLATAAFVAFLSSLTNIAFTAMQYAIFSSLMTLLPKILGGYTGSIVDGIGYEWFFIFTTVLGVPVLVLIWLAAGSVLPAPKTDTDPVQSPAVCEPK